MGAERLAGHRVAGQEEGWGQGGWQGTGEWGRRKDGVLGWQEGWGQTPGQEGHSPPLSPQHLQEVLQLPEEEGEGPPEMTLTELAPEGGEGEEEGEDGEGAPVEGDVQPTQPAPSTAAPQPEEDGFSYVFSRLDSLDAAVHRLNVQFYTMDLRLAQFSQGLAELRGRLAEAQEGAGGQSEVTDPPPHCRLPAGPEAPWLRRGAGAVPAAGREPGHAGRRRRTGRPAPLPARGLPALQLAGLGGHPRPAGRGPVAVRERPARLLLRLVPGPPGEPAQRGRPGELRLPLLRRRQVVGQRLRPAHVLRLRVPALGEGVRTGLAPGTLRPDTQHPPTPRDPASPSPETQQQPPGPCAQRPSTCPLGTQHLLPPQPRDPAPAPPETLPPPAQKSSTCLPQEPHIPQPGDPAPAP
uniref:Uncharacterized protein n=1 Tax=Gopherus evgoodei TaxID=1825980 RepID=A0A8C4YG06_9SAUR